MATKERKLKLATAGAVAEDVLLKVSEATRMPERVCYSTTPRGRCMLQALSRVLGMTMAGCARHVTEHAIINELSALNEEDTKAWFSWYAKACGEAGISWSSDDEVA